ncbi:MAG: Fe-S cluster assembly protein SufB [Oligoflexia bacterium]|nr:Fe-S cluster assembly protein SufB [Oligoflexia bacterium]
MKAEVSDFSRRDYKYGFVTPSEQEEFPRGLSEEIVAMISERKEEPGWLLDFRIKSYRHWLTQKQPTWAKLKIAPIDYQGITYYSKPKVIDQELMDAFEKLGVPLQENKRLGNVAVDAVFDSVSIATTHQKELLSHGVIFCSISEAVKHYPDLVKKYLGSVVPYSDNFFATLNSAVFTDGSFCFIPKGVACPFDLSTYFRINAAKSGQFERTLIVAEAGSSVNYLEGCTAPARDENQLHAAVVELVALDRAEIRYSTIQNWYTGDEQGVGGVYNFVTKRGKCLGYRSKISWTQVEAGAAVTWKYPSCMLIGDESQGQFYSVALTNSKMQADTGTKMIHVGKRTKSLIVAKGISANEASNTYRGMVVMMPSANGARNFSQCDSMLIGAACAANTFPHIDVRNRNGTVEHEASTCRVNEEQLLYLQTRGISREMAVSMIINGFCKEVFKTLPLEFAVEAIKLIEVKLENSVG